MISSKAIRMTCRFLALLGMTAAWLPVTAQNPQRHFTDGIDARFAKTHPVITYRLSVSDRDTSVFNVEMTLRNAPDTFRIAMARHPEYDDEYFRYVELETSQDPRITITRQDSVVWRIVAPDGNATISYKIALPPSSGARAAWKPFLSPTGGLTGGPHTFMYVVGAELAPAHVELRLPTSWRIATGLTPTSDPRTFFAANAYVLVESPILVGSFDVARFAIDGVPHTIAYWRAPNYTRFDTAAFRKGVEGIANEAVKVFGRPPYREYVYMFQDNAWGGLEHHNSVTLGARSDLLAKDPAELLQESAHEYVHTWNLMRIRPAEYTGVSYRVIKPVPTLWFSEGLTIFYADLLLRRAGLTAGGATRTEHLQNILARFLANPASSKFSAEAISRVAYNASPDALGDYSTSAHLQGEVLGAMLDLVVRSATDGKRSMDHVMRDLYARTGGPAGMTGADIEAAVAAMCGCVVKPFFDAHVRGAQPLDVDKYLALIGLKAEVRWDTVTRDNGEKVPDQRLWAFNPEGDSLLALQINNPTTVWAKAGLHSGDRVVSMNGNSVRTWNEFRTLLSQSRIGDIVHLVIKPKTGPARNVAVTVSGYTRPFVTVMEISGASEKQIRLRQAWLDGMP
jgi:predicted metalloprotease with PDZ domain